MASYWTLEYNAQERTFEDWGFTAPRMSPRKLAATTFTVRVPGVANLVANAPIPFKGQVIIRRNREADLSDGEIVLSDGEIVFQGRQITDKRTASRTPAETLSFGDAWWDFENLAFQQQWKYWNGAPASQPFCRLNLFQDFTTGFFMTNGQQLAEIITWAASCGVSIQAGTIDLAWYIQPYPATALSCASAIKECLKPTPGACCYIDMSTTPPTFNCQARDYHTALNLPYASGTHKSSELIPRYDMQAPQVVIQYRKRVSITQAGQTQTWIEFPYDAWPLDATLPAGVQGGKQVGAMIVPIDLADYTRTDIVQNVTAAAFGNPPSLDWWKGKKRAMANYTGLAYVANSLKILDPTGADITSTVLADFPNELTDGQVASWMKDPGSGDSIGVQACTVQAAFTYSETDPQGRVWHTVGTGNPHVIHVNVRLTNSGVGLVPYTHTISEDTGETPVANLAQYTWTLLSQLFWDGSHSIVERNASGAPEVGTIVDCRHAVNLTGGMAAWATMLSPVHGVEIDFTRGTTDVQFGLPKYVGPADLEQLCQFYKFRRRFNEGNLRTTGNAGPQDDGEIGGQTARENTSNSKAPPAFHITASPVEGGGGATTQIGHDADNQEISMKVVDEGGDDVAGFGQVSLKLEDLQYA